MREEEVTFVVVRLSLDLNRKMIFTSCFVSLKDLRFFMFIWSELFQFLVFGSSHRVLELAR
jgi:hypothetical protein